MINLALADLLYLSTIPFVVCTYFAHDWFFGDVGCRLLLSLDLLTMHVSIFFLTAMSLERYWAVARPLQARRASNAYRKLASAILWLLSLLLTAPMMAMTQLQEGDGPHKRICVPTWTLSAFRLYVTVLFTTSVLAPGAVLGIVYTRLAIPLLGLGPGAAGGRPGPCLAAPLQGLCHRGGLLGLLPPLLGLAAGRAVPGRGSGDWPHCPGLPELRCHLPGLWQQLCQSLPVHPACWRLPPAPRPHQDGHGTACSTPSAGCRKPQHSPGFQGVVGVCEGKRGMSRLGTSDLWLESG